MGQQQSTAETARRIGQKLPHPNIETSGKDLTGNTVPPLISSFIAPGSSSIIDSSSPPTPESPQILPNDNEHYKPPEKQRRMSVFRSLTRHLETSEATIGDRLHHSLTFTFDKTKNPNIPHRAHRRTQSYPFNQIIRPFEAFVTLYC